MRPLLTALLALSLLSPARASAPLAVSARVAAAGVVAVSWAPPPGQRLACVFRASGRLLACAAGGAGALRYGPGGWDADLAVAPYERLAVVAYDAEGWPLAAGAAVVRGRVILPVVWR